MRTKIFCDIAELEQIKKFNKKKIVKGFTTNPSLMRKAGAKDYKSYSKKILKICRNKPVSLEVFGDDYLSMKKQAFPLRINERTHHFYKESTKQTHNFNTKSINQTTIFAKNQRKNNRFDE